MFELKFGERGETRLPGGMIVRGPSWMMEILIRYLDEILMRRQRARLRYIDMR